MDYLDSSHPELYKKDYADLPIFDSKRGLKTKWDVGNGDIRSASLPYNEKKRTVVLEITSWMGISIGAIHFYGKLHVQGLEFVNKEKTSRISSNRQPEITRSFNIVVRRPLPKEEKEADPDRYEYYKEGDYIAGFLTTKDLIAAGKRIFKEKFTGDWKFVIKWDR